MKDGTHEEYMEVLAALGSTLAKRKGDLDMARYDINRLKQKLKEAEKEITKLKGEA